VFDSILAVSFHQRGFIGRLCSDLYWSASEKIAAAGARPLKLAGGFPAIPAARLRFGELALPSSGQEISPRAASALWRGFAQEKPPA
jgi:hypothetical protein